MAHSCVLNSLTKNELLAILDFIAACNEPTHRPRFREALSTLSREIMQCDPTRRPHIEEAYRQISSHIDEHDEHDRDGRNVADRSGPIETSLTYREKEIMTWIARGKGSRETGMILNIAERTVKFHLQNVYRKLNVVNRAQAVAQTVAHGLL